MEKGKKERCFIITPIGDDSDPIRRHIEGIIDAAIKPALEDKYEIVVAHKIYEPGSISKQVITEIYQAKLVIANLTNRNPNVMYELAFRHCLGKPAIMIAEKGTPLPSDIILERTIFYQNDARGVLDLRANLKQAESEINFEKTASPIYDVLHEIGHEEKIIELSREAAEKAGGSEDPMKYILQRLNRIEGSLLAVRAEGSTAKKQLLRIEVSIEYADRPKISDEELSERIGRLVKQFPGLEGFAWTPQNEDDEIDITFFAHKEPDEEEFITSIFEMFSDFTGVTLGYEVD